MTADGLATWNDGPVRARIVEFVQRVSQEGGRDYVPPSDRIAVFDNDGTLWCEKPMPIELGFILMRLVEMAEHDETLRTRQPWQAAYRRDYAWLGEAVTKHYRGDDSDVKTLIGGMLQAFAGRTVEEYADAAEAFLRNGEHPTLGRTFLDCSYRPMIDLLRYLEAHGFTNYIASGGDRDFMRVVTEELYGIPADRVIGSSSALGWVDDDDGGALSYQAAMEVFDDGPAKPVRIWSRIGKRPILAAGNANGDIPMLRYAGGRARPALRLLVHHDDKAREFAYTAGAEDALERAEAEGWTVVSCKHAWSTVFSDGDD
jgi:phosphoglycolate phosphatase-like HAD superfamily hydrolase